MTRLLVAAGIGVLAVAALVVRDAAPPGEPAEPARTVQATARVPARARIVAPALPAQDRADDGADDRAGDAPPDDELASRVFLDARAALERDLADGRWSEADRDRLNAALPQVTADQAELLLAILFPALNTGAVTSDLAGPPL